MEFINLLIPFCAAIVAGTLNSVAGGGSFLTFPSLIYAGVPPKSANATNTVALWPGSLASAWALRKELAQQNRALLLTLGLTSLVGGVAGALLLLNTPQETFVLLIPFLMLAATLLFAVSPLINARVRQRSSSRKPKESVPEEGSAASAWRPSWSTLGWVAGLQLVIATYGGYFGGGIGILMLAILGLIGMENIHEMNAVKNMLATCINGVAVVVFVIAGAVVWVNALTMLVGAIAGGYGGAYFARKLDPRLVRVFVILVGCTMTLYFFFKYGFL
jgi:uncharacterized membrane protein YfcA